MREDFCRCPGCGTCEAADTIDSIKKELTKERKELILVKLENKTLKANLDKMNGLKELTRMTEEFGGYQKEQEMLKPCPDCGADTQGTWIRINNEDIWHVGCTRCSWQPYGTER